MKFTKWLLREAFNVMRLSNGPKQYTNSLHWPIKYNFKNPVKCNKLSKVYH